MGCMFTENHFYHRNLRASAQHVVALACFSLALLGSVHAQNNDAASKAEEALWQSIDKASIDELTIYLGRFPGGQFADVARQRMIEAERKQEAERREAERLAAEPPAPLQREVELSPKPTLKPVPKPEIAQSPEIPGRVFAVGDEIAYLINDSLTGLSSGEIRLKFESEQSGVLSAGRGRYLYDVFGNRVRIPSFEYDRAYTSPPRELVIGRKWKTNYERKDERGRFTSWSWSYEVEGRETVTVPAGQFDTFRVFGTTISPEGHYMQNTFWLERNSQLQVKIQEIARRNAQVLSGIVHELKWFRKAGEPSR
jgi:hypothetical protein